MTETLTAVEILKNRQNFSDYIENHSSGIIQQITKHTICDESQSEMQVTPAPRHYQYISIGKAGVQIMQTINTRDNYVATEIMINNNKG